MNGTNEDMDWYAAYLCIGTTAQTAAAGKRNRASSVPTVIKRRALSCRAGPPSHVIQSLTRAYNQPDDNDNDDYGRTS
jgi:hypothetical protein